MSLLFRLLLWGSIAWITNMGCAPKTALYGSYRSAQPTPEAHVSQLFMDRDGSIYPGTAVSIDDNLLKEKLKQGFHAGYLQYYFNFLDTAGYTGLKNTYNISPAEDKTREWAGLQFAMQREMITNLNRKLAEQSDASGAKTTLVVLVHGFNVNQENGKAYDPYKAVEKRVREEYLQGRPVHFLEVYWDGMHGSPFTIWTYAQANAPFAGLTLRSILNGVDHQYPIRILTHSLGATVATNALWNVREAKSSRGDSLKRWWMPSETGNPTYFTFTEMVADAMHYATPRHPDLRLASIAPAQPGSTYIDFLDRTPSIPDAESYYRRIIIGYNNWDYATSKIIRPLAKMKFGLGATSLAVYRKEYDKHVYPLSKRGDSAGALTVHWIDMYPKRIFYTDHALEKYLRQSPATELMRLLFEDAPALSTPPK